MVADETYLQVDQIATDYMVRTEYNEFMSLYMRCNPLFLPLLRYVHWWESSQQTSFSGYETVHVTNACEPHHVLPGHCTLQTSHLTP